MLRFVTRVTGVVKAAPVLAAGLLVAVLAGCDTTSPANPNFTPPAPAQPSAPPSGRLSVPPAPPSEPPHVVAPGLRPLTTWEKQYRDYCQNGQAQNGCEFYSDRSLRLQGIDPES